MAVNSELFYYKILSKHFSKIKKLQQQQQKSPCFQTSVPISRVGRGGRRGGGKKRKKVKVGLRNLCDFQFPSSCFSKEIKPARRSSTSASPRPGPPTSLPPLPLAFGVGLGGFGGAGLTLHAHLVSTGESTEAKAIFSLFDTRLPIGSPRVS